jgi:hypothetical protein
VLGTFRPKFYQNFLSNSYQNSHSSSTKPPQQSHQQQHNLMNNVSSTTLTKDFFYNNKFDTKRQYLKSQDHLPSRWYTVLALPFPDQKLGRRDISTFGRNGYYQSRAGFFSNPSPPL